MKVRRLPLLAAFALLVALPACDSSDSDDEDDLASIEGLWESDSIAPVDEELIARLDLEQNESEISGTIEIEFTESGQVDVFGITEGTYNPPDLSITGETDADDADTESFSCVVQTETAMTCGLGGQEVAFEKQ